MNVDGKVAVVTGAASGIGAALATELLGRGAKVVLTDINAQALAATVNPFRGRHGDDLIELSGDASDEGHIKEILIAAETVFGLVDMYFANAGVDRGAGLDISDDVWSAALNINLLAHVRAARLLIPGWLERGGGDFISTASAAGLVTQIGSPTYAVTKHAAVAFSEWLSITYGNRGIRVSCLCPMGVDTPMLANSSDSEDELTRRAASAVRNAGEVISPDDVANIVLDHNDDEFLILPHPDVMEYFRQKGSDYDRWIRGMRRYQDSLSMSATDSPTTMETQR